jgi:hypothetical protein
LSFVAAILSSKYSRDSSQYLHYFESIVSGDKVAVEISFYIVSIFSNYFFYSSIFVLVFYSFFAVLIKLYLIDKYSSYPYLSLLVFCSYFFLVQEGNMIRAGLASAFFLLASFSYFQRYIKRYLVFSALAFFFHYSFFVIFLLPLVFSRSVRAGFYYSVFYFSLCIFFAFMYQFYDWLYWALTYISDFDPSGKVSAYISLRKSGVFL